MLSLQFQFSTAQEAEVFCFTEEGCVICQCAIERFGAWFGFFWVFLKILSSFRYLAGWLDLWNCLFHLPEDKKTLVSCRVCTWLWAESEVRRLWFGSQEVQHSCWWRWRCERVWAPLPRGARTPAPGAHPFSSTYTRPQVRYGCSFLYLTYLYLAESVFFCGMTSDNLRIIRLKRVKLQGPLSTCLGYF